ncbi:hypothetical protein [Kutzneria buriramensis]|uniref:nSTAND1 domain-containing NTPase n=1 Tax=Kutzneria buriramensis TaxID=1045776 RepID=UPI00319EB316
MTLAYIGACRGDRVARERRWRADAAELAARRTRLQAEARAGDGDGPYVGPAAFQTADAGRFFGRESAVDELARLVAAERFVSVFGASGVGKSSLLRAGLVPAIEGSSVAPVSASSSASVPTSTRTASGPGRRPAPRSAPCEWTPRRSASTRDSATGEKSRARKTRSIEPVSQAAVTVERSVMPTDARRA